jgi:hypothetical protein
MTSCTFIKYLEFVKRRPRKMLEAFTIFHEGGRVLWSRIFSANGLNGNPINQLIQKVLIEVGPRLLQRTSPPTLANRRLMLNGRSAATNPNP